MRVETTLVCVPPDDLDTLWPLVAPLIDAAYAAVDELTPDVLSWLKAQKGLLWIAVRPDLTIRGCITTSLEPKRSGLACRMVACGGDAWAEWAHHLAEIEQYARAEGCVKMIADGRQGWARLLAGYAPAGIKLAKGL